MNSILIWIYILKIQIEELPTEFLKSMDSFRGKLENYWDLNLSKMQIQRGSQRNYENWKRIAKDSRITCLSHQRENLHQTILAFPQYKREYQRCRVRRRTKFQNPHDELRLNLLLINYGDSRKRCPLGENCPLGLEILS